MLFEMFRRKGQVYRRVLAMAPFHIQGQGSSGNVLNKTTPTATLCSLSQSRCSATRTISTSTTCYSITPVPSIPAPSSSPSITRQGRRSISPGSCRNSFAHQHRTYAIIRDKSTRHHDRSHSLYDPELVACMDRWVRIVFHGQRRMNSSLAKPIASAVSPSYPVIDIPIQHNHLLDRHETSPLIGSPTVLPVQQQRDPSLSLKKKEGHRTISLPAFRKFMDTLPIDDHALPIEFSTLKKPSPNAPPKHRLSKKRQGTIDHLWRNYLTLANREKIDFPGPEDDRQLTRSDYTQLMRTIRHGQDPREAAQRILTVKDALDHEGFRLTRKLGEMVIQAHLVLGSTDQIIHIYDTVTSQVGYASAQHKKLLWTIVEGFATNQRFSQGLGFLEAFIPNDNQQERAFYHELYRTLLAHRLNTSSPSAFPEQHREALRVFYECRFPVKAKQLARVLDVIAHEAGETVALLDFSATSVSSLIKQGDPKLLDPLLISLLQACQVPEAVRVRTLMLQHGMTLDHENLRVMVLKTPGTKPTLRRRYKALDEWEQSTVSTETPSSSLPQYYSGLVTRRIEELDLSGAFGVARYMAHRLWHAQDIDFKKLNSHLINFGTSEHYPIYLKTRYCLGPPARPDLHTYRRLIYAACRRSDLVSALGVFQFLRTRHRSLSIDTSLYNAILSTAAVTGHIRVAEKMLEAMVKDGLQPDHYSYEGLLNGYAQSGDLTAALLIPEQMIKQKLVPTTKTFNLVMKAYIGARNDLSTSHKLLKFMQCSGGNISPDIVTFNQILEGYRRVGNAVWFDDYFDQYFGLKSRQRRKSLEILQKDSESDIFKIDKETPKKILRRKRESMLVGPEKVDDKTLLIQLQHSLSLPSVDVSTVKELWKAFESRVDTTSPSSPPRLPLSSSSLVTVDTTIDSQGPETYVPFKRRLGRAVILPVTDQERFRFTMLSLFRDAFRARGDTSSVKQFDRLLRKHFPDHQEVTARFKNKTASLSVSKTST
ncbi:hypothetical protein BGZ83_009902 [Gryganskiella cystojenkinii]|nr:hypothetical protein BGZ83_009902 [Gryganskiella cystojenkinii]